MVDNTSGLGQMLVRERGEEYEDAWKWTSKVIHLTEVRNKPVFNTYHIFLWIMCINKLMRIMFSPYKPDHWADIQGYAQLALNNIKELSVAKDGP